MWLDVVLAVVALGLLVVGYASLVERNLYRVRSSELSILPAGSRPIRVLHISDIHLAPWQKRKMRWVNSLDSLDPDLVVDTGDNLGHLASVRPAISMLEPLLKVPGVFVNGSNDYHAPVLRNPFTYLFRPSTRSNGGLIDTATLMTAMETSGWLNLNNQSGTMTINGVRIGFLGLDDPHDELAWYERLPQQQREVAGEDIVFGIAHAPYLKVIDEFGAAGASLIFAGHTHGGQVCLPGGRAIITNCDLPAKSAKGLSSFEVSGKRVWLNVCAGLGTSIFAPFRLFCPPEVRLITLTAKG